MRERHLRLHRRANHADGSPFAQLKKAQIDGIFPTYEGILPELYASGYFLFNRTFNDLKWMGICPRTSNEGDRSYLIRLKIKSRSVFIVVNNCV